LMKVQRTLSSADKIKLDCVLKKVQLPAAFLDDDLDSDHSKVPQLTAVKMEAPQEMEQRPRAISVCDTLVPSNSKASLNIFQMINSDSFSTDHVSFRPLPLRAATSMPVPADDDLIASAQSFVPDKTSAASQSKKARAKTSKSIVPVAKQTLKADATTPPKRGTEQQQQQKQQHQQMPKPSNYHLDAKGYGSCKVEFYSEKSYIRQFNEETGKYKLIIGCQTGNHWSVVQALAKHVAAGKSKDDLLAIRAKLL
jgi:hypothetical protein